MIPDEDKEVYWELVKQTLSDFGGNVSYVDVLRERIEHWHPKTQLFFYHSDVESVALDLLKWTDKEAKNDA